MTHSPPNNSSFFYIVVSTLHFCGKSLSGFLCMACKHRELTVYGVSFDASQTFRNDPTSRRPSAVANGQKRAIRPFLHQNLISLSLSLYIMNTTYVLHREFYTGKKSNPVIHMYIEHRKQWTIFSDSLSCISVVALPIGSFSRVSLQR